MLKAIIIVTILTLNLEKTEEAYSRWLNYEVVQRGTISDSLANSWGTGKIAGQRYLLMQAQSQSPVLLRFIESRRAKGYQPMQHEGWNATELLVQDPQKLAKQLVDSPFKIVGPPKYLTDKKNILAFQALGPSNELLYFTRIIDPSRSNFNLGQAKSFVDRVFIMVVGGKDIQNIKQFYRDTFKLPVAGPYPYKIDVLSDAYNLAPDTVHSLSLVPLPNQFLIEIDQYPQAAKSLNTETNLLPAGVAMVSFQVDNLSGLNLPFIEPPVHQTTPPYNGRRSATIRGAVGELIELIETPLLDTPSAKQKRKQ